jgi:hypothetical protein
MKRFTVLLFVVLMVCLGCSKDDKLAGSKYIQKVNGFHAFTLEFKADNKASFTNELAGMTSEFEYEVEDDNKIKISANGQNLILALQEDGSITGMFDGTFIKQDS